MPWKEKTKIKRVCGRGGMWGAGDEDVYSFN